MNASHKLKTDSEVFQAVVEGRKTFEIRFNDRDFKVGDELVLLETIHTGEQMKHGNPLLYSGNELRKTVSYVLSGYGLQDGWVILGMSALLSGVEVMRSEFEKYFKENHADSFYSVDAALKMRGNDYIDFHAADLWALWQHQQSKIDELQKRIDDAIALLEYNEYADSPLQALEILKGDSHES